jgi:hypothetical protein
MNGNLNNKQMNNMKTYTGTKTIKATPMTKAQYCEYRGWKVPKDEDPNEEVYLVEYEADILSKPNHPDHVGYISMSPKHVFDKAYRPSETYMDRLLIERDELEGKFKKLVIALDTNQVPHSEITILVAQAKVMGEYLKILNKRIG